MIKTILPFNLDSRLFFESLQLKYDMFLSVRHDSLSDLSSAKVHEI